MFTVVVRDNKGQAVLTEVLQEKEVISLPSGKYTATKAEITVDEKKKIVRSAISLVKKEEKIKEKPVTEEEELEEQVS